MGDSNVRPGAAPARAEDTRGQNLARGGCAVALGLLLGFAAFVGCVELSVVTAHCPPENVCDLPVTAGIAVGLIVFPVVWILGACIIYRRPWRGRARS